jgi:HEAT repeat protein
MSVTPEVVKTLLSSEDYGDRLKAVNLIRQLDLATGFELIQTAIADANVRVRYAAVSQIATLGKHDPAATLVLIRDRLLKDPEPDIQAAAADAIGALKLTEAFEDLKQLYYDNPDQWLVQFSIIATLGELGDPRALDLLETALQSENELVKTAAVGSLAELGDRRALSLLLPYASDADWQIRYRVVQALGRLADPEARTALEALAQDEVESVAEEAKKQLSV